MDNTKSNEKSFNLFPLGSNVNWSYDIWNKDKTITIED